jgi:hypothetical protein
VICGVKSFNTEIKRLGGVVAFTHHFDGSIIVTIRVQWATGPVGSVQLTEVIDNSELDLVACSSTRPTKWGWTAPEHWWVACYCSPKRSTRWELMPS